MAVKTVSELAVFDKGNNLNFIEENGEILFSAEEIGRHLGYSKPADSINVLFRKNQNELKHYATSIKLIAVDGKERETRAFSEEGVYILSMLARTNEAKKFRARVALLLRRLRRERMSREIDLAREAGYRQGIDEARALPISRKEQATARAEGADAMLILHPKRLATLKQALKYAKMGLSGREIAKLIDGNHRQIGHLLSLARKNGLLPASDKRHVSTQGNLLELSVSGKGA